MRHVRRVVLALLFAAAIGLAARPAFSSPSRTVPCQEIIDHPPFPYVSGDPQYRYRVVLGAISVPPGFLDHVVATHERPWAYWRKAGLVVRAAAAVTITVPRRWRNRLAIIWGNGNHPPASSLRIAGCGSRAHIGNAYAGGFYLRTASGCAPLTFRVAGRAATVRFGIGRRCDS